MNVYVPEYYSKFRCIASKCQNTCCAGWEIDIDPESLARYQQITGTFGLRMKQSISLEGTPHFILSENGRCPFLNQSNLCDLILSEGEDALCQICRDHPRFRNYFSSRMEVGLGLVCEEAGRLILSWPSRFRLVRLEGNGKEELTDDERYVLALRDEWISSLPEEGPSTRLMEALIYRHLADALYDNRLDERISFIHNAFTYITSGWKDERLDSLVELARRFSDTVEYDDEVLEGWIAGNSRGG